MSAQTKHTKAVTSRSAKVAESSQRKRPRACRPIAPPGYQFPTSPEGLLDWSWAADRLTKSHNYVIVTVRRDGRPHAMGMHGLWFGDAYYFGTDPATQKARNLAGNANCTVIAENLEELLIVEGVAEVVGYDALPKGLSEESKKKYGWPIDPRMGGRVYKVVPRVVFAFPEKQIATAITKWVFD